MHLYRKLAIFWLVHYIPFTNYPDFTTSCATVIHSCLPKQASSKLYRTNSHDLHVDWPHLSKAVVGDSRRSSVMYQTLVVLHLKCHLFHSVLQIVTFHSFLHYSRLSRWCCVVAAKIRTTWSKLRGCKNWYSTDLNQLPWCEVRTDLRSLNCLT